MKYITIYHANLNYSGLAPERYEFVIRESYEKIIDMHNNELANIPYCFELSGYTLDKMNAYCPDVIDKLKDAMTRNCEVIGSPYPHIMLPNFPYKDGLLTLEFTLESFHKVLNFTPETGWNPELGWRHDIPHMFKSAGFKNLIIDWDAYLISSNKEIREYEQSDGPYGHHLPYYPVDPNSKSLHYPVKIIDGLTGIFRTDRVSNKFLFYIMSAMKDHPLYKDVDEQAKKDQQVTLEEILENIKYWSGTKQDGLLLTYADDAEYIGTTGYFLVKYFKKNEFFLANPSHDKLSSVLEGINALGEGFITVKDAVREYAVLDDFELTIDDDMAWHRTRASRWAETPNSLKWDPILNELSKTLSALTLKLEKDHSEKIKKAWFALTCAENSDGRWPPPPGQPGEFNVQYCQKYLTEAQNRIKELETIANL